MKILYISNHNLPPEFPYGDFLCDSIFHGFRALYGSDVVDYPKILPMYNNASQEVIKKTYGGFTLYKTLPDIEIDRTDITQKIKNKYFDLIVYGQATRCLHLFDIIQEFYPKKQIILLDGEDEIDVERSNLYSFIRHNASIIKRYNGITFKRELDTTINNYLPISFSIPREKIYTGDCIKTKILATQTTTAPGGVRFDSEDQYYQEYRDSYFAITTKKAGWDCLRHYEIIANRCVPYFRDIFCIPQSILTTYPKQLVLEGMQLINDENINIDKYNECVNNIQKHLLDHCTTESSVKYILERLN